jgi:hypothetical protein
LKSLLQKARQNALKSKASEVDNVTEEEEVIILESDQAYVPVDA